MSENHNQNKKVKQAEADVNASNADIIDDLGAAADNQTESAEQIEQEEMSEIDRLAKELADEKAKVEKEKKEYLFLMAEFDNFRKRTIKEKSDIIKNASESVFKGILPIIDDFERGLDAIKNTDDAESVKEGMTLIYNKLMKFMEQNGVKPIESNGQSFDAEYHEAIAMVPTDDESLKGKVIDTPIKGYTINDKVLRYAKVAVGQ